MDTTMWLLVDVADGMFPDEKAVTFQGSSGPVSLFVRSDMVRHEQGGRAAIQVEVLDMDENYGLVGLPAQAMEGASVAKVRRGALMQK